MVHVVLKMKGWHGVGRGCVWVRLPFQVSDALCCVLKEASAGFYDTGAETSGSVPLVCLPLGPKP